MDDCFVDQRQLLWEEYYDEEEEHYLDEDSREYRIKIGIMALQEACMDSFFDRECEGQCYKCSWWFHLCRRNGNSYIGWLLNRPFILSASEYIEKRDTQLLKIRREFGKVYFD